MKKQNIIITLVVCVVFIVTSCKKQDTGNNNNNNNSTTIPKATLSMQVNGVDFTTNNANANFFNSAGTKFGFSFGALSSDSLVGITVNFLDSFDLNRNYQINKNSGSDAVYYNSVNSTKYQPFRAGGLHSQNKARLNYRVVKIHNPTEYIVRCDVDFDGVLYKDNSPNDSIMITNGRIRY